MMKPGSPPFPLLAPATPAGAAAIPTAARGPSRTRVRCGFSLIELLCVMAIIGILASMMLGPLGKALRLARGLAGEVEESPHHIPNIKAAYARYRAGNPTHPTLSLSDFIAQCGIHGKTRDWLKSQRVRFHSFGATDPASQVVLECSAQVIKTQAPRDVRRYTVIDLLTPVTEEERMLMNPGGN